MLKSIRGDGRDIIIGDAADSSIDASSMDKVYGEAMLTIRVDDRKTEIIREANRILKAGGLYGIHELCLVPQTMSDEEQDNIRRDLATTMKVNARPTTQDNWKRLIEKEGFEVINIEKVPMRLLNPSRMVKDEGLFHTAKICYNVLKHPPERRRIRQMQRVFSKYEEHLNAISIVAKKVLGNEDKEANKHKKTEVA